MSSAIRRSKPALVLFMFSYMLPVCFLSGYLRLVVHVLPYELITSYVDVLFFLPLFPAIQENIPVVASLSTSTLC